MDRVIFGDNQFFGINHMSEQKALQQSMRFRDLQAVIDVIDAAYDCGIRTFMFTPHERVRDLCDHFRANADRYAELKLWPASSISSRMARNSLSLCRAVSASAKARNDGSSQ